MENKQNEKKDGGNWAVQFIVAFLVVFLLSGIIANWDTIKEGYDSSKEQRQQEEQE